MRYSGLKYNIKVSQRLFNTYLQNERHQELILEMAEMKKYGAASIGHESLSDAERPSDNLEIDEIMAKLEQVPEIYP